MCAVGDTFDSLFDTSPRTNILLQNSNLLLTLPTFLYGHVVNNETQS
jgi:hypothetical protein